jgi:hypothetical protein
MSALGVLWTKTNLVWMRVCFSDEIGSGWNGGIEEASWFCCRYARCVVGVDAVYGQQIAAECRLLVPKDPIRPSVEHKQVA